MYEENIGSNNNPIWTNSVLKEFHDLKALFQKNSPEFYDLSMINPDIQPDRLLLDRLVEATLKSGQQRYAVARGTKELRQAFCSKYQKAFSVELDPEAEICVTMGIKDAFMQALRCLYTPGAKALIPCPAYPAHIAALKLVGFEVTEFELGLNSTQTLENLIHAAATVKPQLVALNFPHNPTGVTVDSEFWKGLSQWSSDNSTWVINDFVYGEMGFEGQQVSALSYRQPSSPILEVYSLSKAYNVPGWRVGALLGHKDLINAVSQRKSYVDYGLYLPIQNAAAYALTKDVTVQSTTAKYFQRARVLARGLTRLGWEVNLPQAGCCVWARYPRVAVHSMGIAAELLNVGVAALPGLVFGEKFREYCRFALVREEQELMRGLQLIESQSASYEQAVNY